MTLLGFLGSCMLRPLSLTHQSLSYSPVKLPPSLFKLLCLHQSLASGLPRPVLDGLLPLSMPFLTIHGVSA